MPVLEIDANEPLDAAPASAPKVMEIPPDATLDQPSPAQAPKLSVFGTPLPEQPPDDNRTFGEKLQHDLLVLDDTIRMLGSGATLNFADEIAAGMNTILGIGPGETFDENLKAEQARDAKIREREPAVALTAEIAGGVGAAIATGGGTFVAGANTVMGTAGRSALVGAGFGAVAGAGAGTDEESRLTGALAGGSLGAALGGVGIPLTKAAVGTVFNRFMKTTTGGQIRAAAARIRKAMERDELTPDEAFRRLTELGPEGRLADVGENVRGLGRAVAGQPGKAKTIAVEALEGRQEAQGVRVVDAVNRALDPTGDFAGAAGALQQVRKTAAKPLYDAAYAKPVDPSEELIALFRRPALAQAWTRAKRIAANEGEDLPDELFITRPDGGKVVDTDAIRDVKVLDLIKRGLDDLVETKRDPVTGKLQGEVTRGIDRLRKDYIKAVDRLSPDYKAARAAWSGPSRSLELMDRGRRFVRADEEITANQLRAMTDDEKFFFRMGAARQLRDMIFNTPDGADTVKRIFGSELKRRRLRAVFDDEDSFNIFRKTMEQEAEMFRTRAIVSPRSGSQTDLRAAERSDLAGDVGAGVRDLASGNTGNAALRFVRTLFGRGAEKMTPQQAETIARMLFSNDPETNRKIINSLVFSRELASFGREALGVTAAGAAQQTAPVGAEFFSPGQ